VFQENNAMKNVGVIVTVRCTESVHNAKTEDVMNQRSALLGIVICSTVHEMKIVPCVLFVNKCTCAEIHSFAIQSVPMIPIVCHMITSTVVVLSVFMEGAHPMPIVNALVNPVQTVNGQNLAHYVTTKNAKIIKIVTNIVKTTMIVGL